MARGEPPKGRSLLPDVTIGAVFLAFCLCAATGAALTMRDCVPSPVPVAATLEPFVGATAMFHALSWRDSERARSGTASPDGPRARAVVESSLSMRGYVPAPTEGLATLVSLPGDIETPAMGGSCGVLVIVSDGGGEITAAEVSADGAVERHLAHDPSALAVPLCGAHRVHVEGTGSVGGHVWHYPGLTPELVAATTLPADVVLAHAEAETLLRAQALVPRDEIAVIEVSGGAGTRSIPLARTIATGCVPFVGVVVGGGDPMGSWSPTDRISDRALLGLALCATRADASPTIAVPRGTARVYLRPYEAAGAGVRAGVSVGALRIVREADLALPPPRTETPAP